MSLPPNSPCPNGGTHYSGLRFTRWPCLACGSFIDPSLPADLDQTNKNKIPDSTTPILAMRHWAMDKGKIVPPINRQGHGDVWHPGECLAKCQYAHDGLSDTCTGRRCSSCGFYAVWSTVHEYAKHTDYNMGIVFGVVACYGKVRLGSLGLRASRAKIVALHLPPVSRWSPFFNTNKTIMQAYSAEGTKFYMKRDRLLADFEVKLPNNLFQETRSYG